tara:strand:+ start:516 stop:1442 length:927 start_codon:yes stop_codon:yes gene_type:complete
MVKKLKNRGNSSSISTIISLSLVLFVIGLLSFVLINAKKSSDLMKESIGFTIMLKDVLIDESITKKEEIDKLLNKESLKFTEFKNYLSNSEYFKEVIFIDKQTATENHKKDLGEDFEITLGFSPLLNSIDTKVKAEYVSPKGLIEIEKYIDDYKGGDIVQEKYYQKNLVEKLNTNVKRISLFLLSFCLIFLLISFALINNTIRLAVYSKRLLIRTMRLVGATNIFIQKPYLLRSFYQGFYSSIVAIFMLIGSLELLKNQIPDFINTNDYQQIGIIFILILIFGIFISWVSTFFAVRRYLNLNENELYN